MIALQTLLGLCLGLLTYVGAGVLLCHLAGMREHLRASLWGWFVRLLVGWLAVTWLQAVVLMRGETVLWGLPLVAALFWPLLRAAAQAATHPLPGTAPRWPQWTLLLMWWATFLALAVLNIYDWDTGYLLASRYQPEETLHYAQVAAWLTNGHESRNTVQPALLAIYQGNTPYHYLDLYTHLWLSWLSGLSPYLSLHLVMKPLFQAVLVMGLWGFMQQRLQGRAVLWLGLLAGTLVGLPYWQDPMQMPSGYVAFLQFYTPLILEKLLPVSLLLLVVLGSWLQGFRALSLGLSLLLLWAHVATAPFVAGWCLVGVLALMVAEGWKQGVAMALRLAVPLVGLVVFYGLTAAPVEENRQVLQLAWIVDGNWLKLALATAVLSAVALAWLHLPWLAATALALVRQRWLGALKAHRYLLLALFLGLVLSWGAYQYLIYFTQEGVQFYWSLHLPVVAILLAWAFAKLWQQGGRWQRGLAVGVCTLLGVWQLVQFGAAKSSAPVPFKYAYSQAYLQQMEETMGGRPLLQPMGIGLKGSADYAAQSHVDTWIFGCPLLYRLQPQLYFVQTCWDSLPAPMYARPVVQDHIRAGYYTRWLATQPPRSRGAQLAAFVQQHGVQYGLAYRHATIPPEVQLLVKYTVQDSTSGERLLVFR
jgi:hypothetical protein